jgi:hypothetical protein
MFSGTGFLLDKSIRETATAVKKADETDFVPEYRVCYSIETLVLRAGILCLPWSYLEHLSPRPKFQI